MSPLQHAVKDRAVAAIPVSKQPALQEKLFIELKAFCKEAVSNKVKKVQLQCLLKLEEMEVGVSNTLGYCFVWCPWQWVLATFFSPTTPDASELSHFGVIPSIWKILGSKMERSVWWDSGNLQRRRREFLESREFLGWKKKKGRETAGDIGTHAKQGVNMDQGQMTTEQSQAVTKYLDWQIERGRSAAACLLGWDCVGTI